MMFPFAALSSPGTSPPGAYNKSDTPYIYPSSPAAQSN